MKHLFLILLAILVFSCSSDSSDSDSNNNNTSSQKITVLEGNNQYRKMYFHYSNGKLDKVINNNTDRDLMQISYQNGIVDKVIVAGYSFEEGGLDIIQNSTGFDFDLNLCTDCVELDYIYSTGTLISIERDGHPIMEYDYNGSYLSETRYYTYNSFPSGQELHRRIQYVYTSGKLSGYSVTETDSGSTHTDIYTVMLDDKKNPFFDFEAYTGLYIPNAPSIYSRHRLHVNPTIKNNITHIYDSSGASIFSAVYQYDNNDYPTSYELNSASAGTDSGTFSY